MTAQHFLCKTDHRKEGTFVIDAAFEIGGLQVRPH